MDDITREKLLKIALVTFGAIFFTIYPLSLIWPSGWQWHSGHGQYYLQMICGIYAVLGVYLIAAARNPSEHRSLISFTVWSSIVHAGIMAVQATYDGHEIGHLVGDVPALLLVAAVPLVSRAGEAAASGQHIVNAVRCPHRYLVGKIHIRAAGAIQRLFSLRLLQRNVSAMDLRAVELLRFGTGVLSGRGPAGILIAW